MMNNDAICEFVWTHQYAASRFFHLSIWFLTYIWFAWLLSCGGFKIRRSMDGGWPSTLYFLLMWLMGLGRRSCGWCISLCIPPISNLLVISRITPSRMNPTSLTWRAESVVRGSYHLCCIFLYIFFGATTLSARFTKLWFPIRSMAAKSDFLEASSIVNRWYWYPFLMISNIISLSL